MNGGQEPRTADESVEWYLARDGQQYGPLSQAEMLKLVEFGHLKSVDLVWRAGFAEWTPAATAFPETARAAPPPPPPPRAAPAQPAPAQAAPAQATPARTPERQPERLAEQTAAPRERRDVQTSTQPATQSAAQPTRQPSSQPSSQPDARTSPGAQSAPRDDAPTRDETHPAWAAAARRANEHHAPQSPQRTGLGRDPGIAWPESMGTSATRAPQHPAGQHAAGHHPANEPPAAREAPSWPGAGPVPQGQVARGPVPQGPAPHGPSGAYAPQDDNRPGHRRGPTPGMPQAAPAGYAPTRPAPNWNPDAPTTAPPPGERRRPPGRSRNGDRHHEDAYPAAGPVVEEEHYEPERRRGGLVVMLVLLLILGVLAAGGYGLYTGRISPELAESLKARLGLGSGAATAEKTSIAKPPATAAPKPTATAATSAATGANAAADASPTFPKTADALDGQLQTSTMWQMVKTDFPAWYQERVKEAARRSAENQEAYSVQRYLLESLVALRRENARHAYAAGLEPMKGVADAFRNNLVNLTGHSETACYTFISMGEGARGIAQLYHLPKYGPLLEAQMVAVLAAVREGQRRPVTSPQPRKDDYAVLSEVLKQIGWSEDDLKLFADADGLAKTEPAKVCRMVTDWFSAHLRLKDQDVQQRLLAESIRPVIGG